MDPICHTLTGAVIGKAGLARRTTLGLGTLMIAANLPDVDVGVYLTNTMVVSFRRGWTHGVLAQAVLPLVLAGVMLAVARLRSPDNARASARQAARSGDNARASARQAAPASFRELALLSYVGVFSHVFLDFLNSYGVRLLKPFSDRWFYGDALYIVDPWMYLMLGFGLWLATRREKRGDARPWQPARIALALVSVYIVAMVAGTIAGQTQVRDGLVRAGRPPDTRFMVTPVAVNPFRREVLVDVGDRYEKGFVWFNPSPQFRPAGYGVPTGFNEPEVREILSKPMVRTYLMWSRFPFFVVDRSVSPARVRMNDYRYSDASARPGWAGFLFVIDR